MATSDNKEIYLTPVQPRFGFDCVGGLIDVKRELKREIKFYKYYTEKKRGFEVNGKLLFTGPPGTGKTLLAEAMAKELGWDLYLLDSSTIISKFLGQTAQNLGGVFDSLRKAGERAKKEQKGIVFFVDEVDFIALSRTSNDLGEVKRIVTAFLTNIEANKFSDTRILTIAATNHPKILDQAALSRFDVILEFQNPAELDRREILEILFKGYQELDITFSPSKDQYLMTLAKNTPNLNGRDLRGIVQTLVKEAVVSDSLCLSEECIRGENIRWKLPSQVGLADQSQINYPVPRSNDNALNQDQRSFTVFHSEINLPQYEEILRKELDKKGRVEEFKKFAESFQQLKTQLKESLRHLDFFFLHLDNPIDYLDEFSRSLVKKND